ncbi:MAG: LacI family DNA-binding transcriptional regulator [Lentisphaerae bacterium]|nr:LacI family DNA-binding transcriptional regulator [Lentisphaerota bacterium]
MATGKARQQTVTMKDIAERIGVTPATVSRALNAATAHQVSEKVRTRVSEEADHMGYRLNPFARRLRLKRSETIGVVVELLQSISAVTALAVEYLAGIADEAGRRGYDITMLPDYPKKGLGTSVVSFDGIVSIVSEPKRQRLSDELRGRLPHVSLAGFPEDRQEPAHVAFDQRGAVTEMLTFLHGRGYKRIGCMAVDTATRTTELRVGAYRDAMRALKRAARVYPLRDPNAPTELPSLIQNMARDQLDVVFCTTDLAACQLMLALRSSFPDFSPAVAGFDDLPGIADVYGLTTIREPRREAGAYAVQELIRLIEGGGSARVRRKLFPGSVTVRTSA